METQMGRKGCAHGSCGARGCAGVAGGTRGARRLTRRHAPPSPQSSLCRTAGKRRRPLRPRPNHPRSIHLFKGLRGRGFTPRGKETTSHNENADYLSFQPSFFKHWGAVRAASGKRTNTALRAPALAWWQKRRAPGLGAGLPTKQPRCSGALQWTCRALHTARRASDATQPPSWSKLSPRRCLREGVVTRGEGWRSGAARTPAAPPPPGWKARALIAAWSSPQRTHPSQTHHLIFLRRILLPQY